MRLLLLHSVTAKFVGRKEFGTAVTSKHTQLMHLPIANWQQTVKLEFLEPYKGETMATSQ